MMNCRPASPNSLLPGDAVDGRQGVAAAGADDDALARGQPVGFHDQRHRFVAAGIAVHHIPRGAVGIAKDAILGRRHVGPVQHVLAKDLAAFELGGRLRRAEDPQLLALKHIDDAGDQRRFRADDRQLDRVLLHELDQAARYRRPRSATFSASARRARIARRDEHPLDARAGGDLPRQRMLATSVANDQNFHARLRSVIATSCQLIGGRHMPSGP